jgi:predicted kinase
MELVILIGLQASGKSSFFKERFADTHVRINLDMLKTRHREKLLFEACLAARQPCVVDNTNPRAEDRARYIPAARAAGFRVAGYYFQSKLEECQKRNQARPGKKAIPLGGLLRAHALLEPPKLSEGFDALYYVRIGAENSLVVEEWQEEGLRLKADG